MLDFSAAFDIIDQSAAGKRYVIWLYTSAILWIKDYLSNRTVFFNGSLSNIIQVESDIPQSNCLGPLHFSIFSNDMPFIGFE